MLYLVFQLISFYLLHELSGPVSCREILFCELLNKDKSYKVNIRKYHFVDVYISLLIVYIILEIIVRK